MPIDRSTIQQLCTETVFERGRTYREEGRIENLTRFDDVVTAQVRGSKHYDVQINLDSDDFEPRCTCPYDGPGQCKHVVAVLLSIAADPPENEAARVDSLLDALSADDLRTFVRKELAERPDFRERFLTQSGTTLKTADEYRTEIDQLFEEHTDDYPVVTEAIDFTRFQDLAERYRTRGEFAQAALIYRGLSEGIAENMNLVDAAHDHYAQTFQSALDGYVECLSEAEIGDDSYEDHLDYLSRRSREAVDYLARRYAAALAQLESE